MHTKRPLTSMLACTLLLLGSTLAQARESKPGASYVEQMARNGWSLTFPGVLQRQIGGQTETIGVGLEGFRAALQERQNLLGFYLGEYEVRPSKSLSQTIETLSAEVKQFRAYVAMLEEKGGKPADFDALLNTGCSLSIAYDATAVAQTAQQGVAGLASSSLSSNCGLGNTYVSTYGYATQAGVTHTLSCSDAKYNGSSLVSTCTTLVAGGLPCYSQAYASVTVPPFGGVAAVTYSGSQTNYSCPPSPNPPHVTIAGPTSLTLSSCEWESWSAVATDGTPPYTFQSWTFDGASSSPGSSFTQLICPPAAGSQNHTLRVDIRDNASLSASNQITVTVTKIDDPCVTNPCAPGCFNDNPCLCSGDPCCLQNLNGMQDPVKQRICTGPLL